MHKLKGDTLIEVALAIGIFSMVAVAVVAVVSGSTSSAQSALELTITREEIDAQAEAIRFIQSSYISGGISNIAGFSQEKYVNIWKEITSHALDPLVVNDYSTDAEFADAVLNYNPATCSELYDFSDNPNVNSIVRQNAFIINTRNLGAEDKAYTEYEGGTEKFIEDNVVLSAATEKEIFQPTATYPRIMFNGNTDALYDSIYDEDSKYVSSIDRVEGLFVIAVKDKGSLVVVPNTNKLETKSAYYDFYIRSCWFAPGAERPSTISTVIRLQDPAVIDYNY